MFGSHWFNLWSVQEGIKIIIIILGVLKIPVNLEWIFAYYFLWPGNNIVVWFERSLCPALCMVDDKVVLDH